MIQTVRQRQALTPRREPYWYPVGTGQHVGYRRTDDGGSWIARAYDAGTRKRVYQALPEVAHKPAGDQFTEAVKMGRQWFDHLGKGGSSEVLTVRQACARYVRHICSGKGETPAADAAARFARHVDPDPIASIPLPKLSARHVRAWRERLQDKPAAAPKRGPNCRSKDAQPAPRKRAPASLNRDMAALRAALNLAHAEGHVTSDTAWKAPLRPLDKADRRRTLYLDRDQRRALLSTADAEVRPFLEGLCLLPLRPGALAALTVADLDSRTGSLRIGQDKAGSERRIPLPAAAAALMKHEARSKTPRAPLFSRANGLPWDRQSWKGKVKAAAEGAGLPSETTAYTLRHSTITDLVTGGLDLFTIAALSGTGTAMIEKHYGHLQHDRARAALEGLAL